MPAACARAGIFWCAFLHNTSRRYAVMLTPDRTRRLAQKYGRQRERIADTIFAPRQAREVALGAWSAVDVYAHLHPLESDADRATTLYTYPGMAQSEPRNSPFTVAGRNAAFYVSGIGAGVNSNAALCRRDNRV